MNITQNDWEELCDCRLFQELKPRYKKVIEWALRNYIEASEEEPIEIPAHIAYKQINNSIHLGNDIGIKVNQRDLLNLNRLDFDFGLKFLNDDFMPFFGKDDIALFNGKELLELEVGDICLIWHKNDRKFYLTTFEDFGFLEIGDKACFNCDDVCIEGILVNIETK